MRLPGGSLVRRAVPALCAHVGHPHQALSASRRAGQLRLDDLNYFNGWLDARQAGNTQLATIYRRRFRPEFVPAFNAWMAQRPFTNPRAIPGPLYMPQYRSADLVRSAKLDAAADELYTEGTQAKTNDDRYILSTVCSLRCCSSRASRCAWTGAHSGSRCSA